MDAVKFIKEINRLCEAKEDCKDCPLIGHACDVNTATIMRCYNIESVQNMVQIVEQWAKDHPVKTRQSELLKVFPNTKIDSGVIIFCPRNFLPEVERDEYCKGDKSCIECRKEYWLTEVSE